VVEVVDELAGPVTATVDDFVVCRADGVVAYNLAVVVDDAAGGIQQVVRGDDLLPTTPRQVLLAHLLGLPVPRYAHVPLVLGTDGVRLAKRHGSVTLADLAARGIGPSHVLARIAASVGLAEVDEELTAAVLLDRFDPRRLPAEPWVVDTATW
jgi:glutamyl-tRNA synthetase